MSHGIILTYHRVDADPRDPWYLRVDPDRFDDQLRLLTECHQPISLREMTAAAQAGEIPPNAVAVTFDDGYHDNLTTALPLLERHRVPVTFFIATGFVEHQQPFPHDQLEELFLGPEQLPEEIEFRLDGVPHRWFLDGAATPADSASWRAWEPPPSSRHQALVALAPILERMTPEARRATIEELERWTGHRIVPPRPRQPMTLDQLRKLARSDLVEIGAHSVWHPMLTLVAGETGEREVRASKRWLEEALDEEVVCFAYPHGAYDDDVKSLVADAGFVSACTTRRGAVDVGTDAFALPRLSVDG